jgi:CheY-like chemotaxis protein
MPTGPENGVASRQISIILVNAQATVRSRLKRLLESERDFSVVAEASDIESARSDMREHRADVVVLALETSAIPTLDLVGTLNTEPQHTRFVVLDITKRTEEEALTDAIRLAMTSCETDRAAAAADSRSDVAEGQQPDGDAAESCAETLHSETGFRSSSDAASDAGDYAALALVFVAGLTSVIAVARRHPDTARIEPHELPALALATFALADTVAREKVSTWLRRPFVIEDNEHRPIAPKGRGLRHAIGELLTCTRCVGTWSGLLLVGLRTASPSAGRTSANVLALAGANDLMQSGFRLMVERANRASIETETAQRPADTS